MSVVLDGLAACVVGASECVCAGSGSGGEWEGGVGGVRSVGLHDCRCGFKKMI